MEPTVDLDVLEVSPTEGGYFVFVDVKLQNVAGFPIEIRNDVNDEFVLLSYSQNQ